jgi:hypothetical protein
MGKKQQGKLGSYQHAKRRAGSDLNGHPGTTVWCKENSGPQASHMAEGGASACSRQLGHILDAKAGLRRQGVMLESLGIYISR